MRRWEFYIPCVLKPLNKQRSTNRYQLGREEKAKKEYMTAFFNTWCPKDAFVNQPHPQRRLHLLVVRGRLVDDDALGAMCKPLIDVLKCIHRKVHGTRVMLQHGIVYEDSRRFVRMSFDQILTSDYKRGEPTLLPAIGVEEGVRITLEAD